MSLTVKSQKNTYEKIILIKVTRPIKIRHGLYCMGDSAHVQTESPRIWVTRILYSKPL